MKSKCYYSYNLFRNNIKYFIINISLILLYYRDNIRNKIFLTVRKIISKCICILRYILINFFIKYLLLFLFIYNILNKIN